MRRRKNLWQMMCYNAFRQSLPQCQVMKSKTGRHDQRISLCGCYSDNFSAWFVLLNLYYSCSWIVQVKKYKAKLNRQRFLQAAQPTCVVCITTHKETTGIRRLHSRSFWIIDMIRFSLLFKSGQDYYVCFMPRLSISFYTKPGKIVAVVTIYFSA